MSTLEINDENGENRMQLIDAMESFNSSVEVGNFLERFHISSDVDDVFTKGCCYWFAWILLERFSKKHPILMYDSVDNHFGVMIGERVYDITGDVTEKYSWEEWDSIDDEYLKSYIKRDCIMF